MNNSSINGSEPGVCDYWHVDGSVTASLIVLPVILGTLVNVFIIILAVKRPNLTDLHYLIINMAVSDVLFFVMFIIMNYYMVYDDLKVFSKDIFGFILCKIVVFLNSSAYMVSLMTLLVISIQRFRATNRTLQRSRPYTLKQRVAVLGITWLLPFALNIGSAYSVEPSDEAICRFSNLNNTVLIFWLIGDFLFVVACFVVLFLSILTIKRLYHPQTIDSHLSEDQLRSRAKRTRAAVRWVLASVIIYICCTAPSFVYSVLVEIANNFLSSNVVTVGNCFHQISIFFILRYILPSLNACFSPWLYMVFLREFRTAAKNVFCRRGNEVTSRNNSIVLQSRTQSACYGQRL